MIAFVYGIVEEITEDCVILDVHGMGYHVRISSNTASRLPAIGEPVKLYTYMSVREDAVWLYGFLSKNELDIFKKCITVSGIGPKGALSILSVLSADELRYAILSEDKKAISKAPGIGARTAERLILELKDKVAIDDSVIQREINQNTQTIVNPNDSPEKAEALEALQALGYHQTECLKAFQAIPNIEELDSGAILKAALKHIF